MNISYSGGTAQQVAWAQAGLRACSLPLDTLPGDVTIIWTADTPTLLRHPYMCTTENDDGTFTISIEPWADDPTNPNLRGLPDPPADIKDFYEQSLIHEIGHVIHFTRITDDDQKAAIAALFWTVEPNSATGRRFGTLADWSTVETSDLSWAEAIIEAVAECVKCTFFTGRLVFMNRTLWRIDPQEWNTFVTLLFGSGAGFDETWATDSDGQVSDAAEYTYYESSAGLVVPEGYPHDHEPVLSGHQHTDWIF